MDVSIRQRIRYRFDNVLARGTGAALIWLGAVTFAAVLVSSLLLTAFGVTLTGSEDGSWLEDVWQSLLRILDTGTMAGDVGWGRRILALIVTLFGLLVAGTLIGVIAAGVEARIDGMRRGRSVVIESDHLVILGGSSRIPEIIRQLVLANAERASNTIVVLAEIDPTELRRSVVAAISDRHRTRIVYRFGDPKVRSDLQLARVGEARGAIVLPTDDDGDVSVVQTVLALNAELGGLHDLPVVVEVAESATAERLVEACGPTMHPVITTQAVARISAFALRQRGLGKVVNEFLDFQGCDIHITDRPELVGRRFDEIVGYFTNARSLGFARCDGRFELNPPADSTMSTGDRLVVIAHDLETIESDPTPARLERQERDGDRPTLVAAEVEEHILVVGWNALGPVLLSGWAAATSPSSTVEVAFDPRLVDVADVVVDDLGVEVRLTPTSETSSLSLERLPTTIVVLGYTSLDSASADGRTMLDVLQLRRRIAQLGAMPRFVVQMLDDDHVDLADLTGPDDFLISAAMGSRFIAQLIEQPERRSVLLELYGAGGASVRLIRCDDLDLVGTFTTTEVATTAFAAGVLAIGWHRTADRREVVLNPSASDRVTLAADDEIVVVG